jgi:mannose-6-phosphate isomerase-like protein (cupin superfamily)
MQQQFSDHGNYPFVINLQNAALCNDYFRRTLWTGEHLQLTLMSIPVRSDIGLERHPHLEQLLYIEHGQGFVMMGKSKDYLNFQQQLGEGSGIIVPANTWHNLINTGNTEIKLFSIYAPPQHPFGTVHKTKAEAAEHEY